MSEKICNKCGKKFDMWDDQENFVMLMPLGYGVKYDGDFLDLKLCCTCLEWLVDECTVSPIVKSEEED